MRAAHASVLGSLDISLATALIIAPAIYIGCLSFSGVEGELIVLLGTYRIPSPGFLTQSGSEALSSIVLLCWVIMYTWRYTVDKSVAHVSMCRTLISKGQ